MDETSAACEDLRYFERRLTEVIQSMQPAATRWRCKLFYIFSTIILLVAFGCTLWSAYFWLKDPSIRTITLVESLQNHLVFSACVPSLLFLFGFIGIHNRAVAPSILFGCLDSLHFACLRDYFVYDISYGYQKRCFSLLLPERSVDHIGIKLE
uniref:Transmembrane protein 188 n=1 Tax=Elaeophora elaphi TaxID=1147741 RepID=A0A0R3RZ02_9BILA